MAFAEYSYADQGLLDNVEQDEHVRAAHFLDFVRKTAAMAGVPCATVVATNAHPYSAIVDTANEHHRDLIIMTSRFRRGLAAMLMSSEAERVLHRTSIPVLMFRALMSADHPDKWVPREQDLWRSDVAAGIPEKNHFGSALGAGFHGLSQRE
jgi:hypothetical protein